jgi:hypothetical protein
MLHGVVDILVIVVWGRNEPRWAKGQGILVIVGRWSDDFDLCWLIGLAVDWCELIE